MTHILKVGGTQLPKGRCGYIVNNSRPGDAVWFSEFCAEPTKASMRPDDDGTRRKVYASFCAKHAAIAEQEDL